MKKEWGREKEREAKRTERERDKKKKVESTKPHFTQVSVT